MAFCVNSKFASHPAVFEVPLAALGLWVRAGAWSAEYKTAGFLPLQVVRILGETGLGRCLANVGLWEIVGSPDNPDGYQFSDWNGELCGDDVHGLA